MHWQSQRNLGESVFEAEGVEGQFKGAASGEGWRTADGERGATDGDWGQ